eukprot:1726779-Alexandrium_andersonii.AAC.1
MKERVRSINQGGKRRHSRTARTHSGDSRSKALLWSIKRTARPPGLEGNGKSTGGSQASTIGPKSAEARSELAEPSRSDRSAKSPRRPSRCCPAKLMFCLHVPPCRAACQEERVGSTSGPIAPT